MRQYSYQITSVIIFILEDLDDSQFLSYDQATQKGDSNNILFACSYLQDFQNTVH